MLIFLSDIYKERIFNKVLSSFKARRAAIFVEWGKKANPKNRVPVKYVTSASAVRYGVFKKWYFIVYLFLGLIISISIL